MITFHQTLEVTIGFIFLDDIPIKRMKLVAGEIGWDGLRRAKMKKKENTQDARTMHVGVQNGVNSKSTASLQVFNLHMIFVKCINVYLRKLKWLSFQIDASHLIGIMS